MILRGPITPWEFKAARGRPVSTPYEADTTHYGKNITGDIYESGWISEMYGYSFGATELKLHHVISNKILIYSGYVPGDLLLLKLIVGNEG
ncbi:hypothetical protein Hanom_Chr09g00764301 [Helianthus anomalus]